MQSPHDMARRHVFEVFGTPHAFRNWLEDNAHWLETPKPLTAFLRAKGVLEPNVLPSNTYFTVLGRRESMITPLWAQKVADKFSYLRRQGPISAPKALEIVDRVRREISNMSR